MLCLQSRRECVVEVPITYIELTARQQRCHCKKVPAQNSNTSLHCRQSKTACQTMSCRDSTQSSLYSMSALFIQLRRIKEWTYLIRVSGVIRLVGAIYKCVGYEKREREGEQETKKFNSDSTKMNDFDMFVYLKNKKGLFTQSIWRDTGIIKCVDPVRYLHHGPPCWDHSSICHRAFQCCLWCVHQQMEHAQLVVVVQCFGSYRQ